VPLCRVLCELKGESKRKNTHVETEVQW